MKTTGVATTGGSGPLQVRINAKSETLSLEECIAWSIEIYIDGESVVENETLHDPYDDEDRGQCQWYLEKYICKSPFSMDSAREVAKSLQRYSKHLIQELHLNELITPRLRPDNGQMKVCIEITEGKATTSTTNTIHQLHWELLEDPGLWEIQDVQVTVQRVFNSPRSGNLSPTPNPIASWRRANSAVTSVNILLVVARRTTDSDLYSEVDPTLASNILLKSRKMLQNLNPTARLKVEIVRPGTFEALQNHLSRSERIHGPGYYHVVHLDMHGQVGLRNGHVQKFGFLYFSHPETEGLKACTPTRVARLLKQHRVPIAVLNACESARANCGDDANIAKTFANEGVQNVLAMTFKISSHAASIFLGTFYQELLIQGSSFSGAVATGRNALRAAPSRFARFDLKRELVDWFVPVVYSSGVDLILTGSSTTPGSTRPIVDIHEAMGNLQLDGAEVKSTMANRDFDVLRLEKVVIKQKKVFLHGTLGVGKSTFLKYAVSLWKETSFVDNVVFIDLEADNISTAEDLVNLILKQLLETGGADQKSSLWTNPPLSTSSLDQQSAINLIVTLLAKTRTVFILDHLHIAFSDWTSSKYVPNLLNEDAKTDIAEVLAQILGSTASRTAQENCFVICTSRHPEYQNLQSQLGIELKGCEFELGGLTLADSIELALPILKRSGVSVQDWQQEDHEALDFVLSLLQGIPAALEEILPLATLLNIPWRQFFRRLCNGLFTHVEELQAIRMHDHSMLKELTQLSETVSSTEFFTLMHSALFWHEGPFLRSLADMASSLYHDDKEDSDVSEQPENQRTLAAAEAVLAFGVSRGYLRIGPLNSIAWIHPLFTVYGRPFIFLTNAETDGAGTNHRTTNQLTAGADIELKEMMVEMIEERSIAMAIQNQVNGVEYEEMVYQHSHGHPNFLKCIEACIGSDHRLALDKWPRFLFATRVPFLNFVLLTSRERRYTAELCYQLLQTFFELNKGFDVEPASQDFVFLLILHTSHTFLYLNNEDTERGEQLYVKAIAVIEASQKPDPDLVGLFSLRKRTLFLATYAKWLIIQNRQEEARSILHKLVVSEDEVCSLVEKLDLGQIFAARPAMAQNRESALISLIAGQEGGVKSSQPNLARGNSSEFLQSFFTARHLSSEITLLLQVKDNEKDNAKAKADSDLDAQALIDGQSKYLRDSNQLLEIVGIHGVKRAKEWWSKDFSMATYATYTNELQRLEAIEQADAAGNWVEAMNHHDRLWRDSWRNFDRDQAIEHVDAFIALHKKSALFQEEVDRLTTDREKMEIASEVHELVSSMLEGPQLWNSIVEKGATAIDSFERAGIPATQIEMIRSIHQMICQTKPSSVEVKKNWFRKLMKSYGAKQGLPGFTERLTTAFPEFFTAYFAVFTLLDGDDLDALEGAVEKAELATKNEVIEEYLRAIGLEDPNLGLKRAFELRKTINTKVKKWQDAVSAHEFDVARRCVSDLKSLVEKNNLSDKGSIGDLKEATIEAEKDYYLGEITAANAAVDCERTEKRCTEFITLLEAGYFPGVADGLLFYVKTIRLRAQMNMAIRDGHWKKGMAYSHEMTKLAAAYPDEEFNKAERDAALDCRECCEIRLLLAGFDKAAKYSTLDLQERQGIMRRLREIYDIQQSTSFCRTFSPILDADLITGLELLVVMEQAMYQLGGRDMVLRFYQGLAASTSLPR
jgi:hypothetical protein